MVDTSGFNTLENAATNPWPKGPFKERLNFLIQEIGEFWKHGYINHFTNHGTAHSERIFLQKLSQLAQELRPAEGLTDEERFIISAAAWLFEVGMQSPNLEAILGKGTKPGMPLTDKQKQLIRKNKHELTYRLLIDSVSRNYQGPSLPPGLPRTPDDYLQAIAEVCRHCSESAIEKAPETIPVVGLPVRIRLMAALLRLADQLYIDSSRVNLDVLQQSTIPMDEKAYWWAYHYTQILPLERGKILFHYSLPMEHKPLWHHIRALLEPQFEYENNEVIRYLRNKHDIRLMLGETPSLKLEQSAEFHRTMNHDMVMYLRQNITPLPAIEDTISVAEETPVQEKCLAILDLENLILHLGKTGHFLAPQQLQMAIIDILREIGSHYPGDYEYLAIGHQGLEIVESITSKLEIFSLLHIRHGQDTGDILQKKLNQLIEDNKVPNKLILVAPPKSLLAFFKDAKQRKIDIYAWIIDLPETSIYKLFANNFVVLTELIDLPLGEPLEHTSFESQKSGAILLMDHKLLTQHHIFIDDALGHFKSLESLKDRAEWWQLYLMNQNVTQLSEVGDKTQITLNEEHNDVLKVRDQQKAVIEAIQAFEEGGLSGIEEDKLIETLPTRIFDNFNSQKLAFLKVLKELDVLFVDARDRPGVQPMWQLNPQHHAVATLDIEKNIDSSTSLLVLAIDQWLVDQGYRVFHEHTLTKRVVPSSLLPEPVVEVIYNRLISQDILKRHVTDKKHRITNANLIEVQVNEDSEVVGQSLLNRDILLDVLYRESSGFEQKGLLQKLRAIRAFTARDEEVIRWFELLKMQRVILTETGADDNNKVMIKLNLESPLTRRLLGRRNLFGLVTNLRIMNAKNRTNSHLSGDVVTTVAKYVTFGDRPMAGWTLDYAKIIKLVRVNENQGEGKSVDYVSLNDFHSFVKFLDQKENEVCQGVADLVNRLQRNSNEWVPQHLLIRRMEQEPSKFGFSREEKNHWIGQCVHRQKLIEEKSERDSRGRREYSYRPRQMSNR